MNYSLGLVLRPSDSSSVTVDAYQISVQHRITLSSFISNPEAQQILAAAEGRLTTNFSSSLGYARSVTPSATAGAAAAAPPLTSFFTLLAQESTTLNAGVSQAD